MFGRGGAAAQQPLMQQSSSPQGATLQFGTSNPPLWPQGRPEGMGGRGNEIEWAVSRLTADEARGKVALLTEELKQMKLMNTEIKLVKDALRRQQKELAQLDREGAALQTEVSAEQQRRLELARMLSQAKKDNPLLDDATYPLAEEDLEDRPLHSVEADEAPAPAASVAEAQPASPAAAPEEDQPMDDLLSLIMGNTAAGAQMGLAAAPAPESAFGASPVMPVASSGGLPVFCLPEPLVI